MTTKPETTLYERTCREIAFQGAFTAAVLVADYIDTQPGRAAQQALAARFLPVLTAGRLVAITLGLDPLYHGQ